MKKLYFIFIIFIIALLTIAVLPHEQIFAEENGKSADVGASTQTDTRSIREGGQTIDAGTIPEKPQSQGSIDTSGDIDGDGYGDVTSVKPDYLDPDSDDDGIKSEINKEIEVIEYKNGDSVKVLEINTSTPKLLEALSIEANSPLLHTGIQISVTADKCSADKSNDCDDGDDELRNPSASFGITVVGSVVRGWDSEQKEVFQNRAEEIRSIDTPSEFSIWLTTKVLENESISELSTLHDYVEIKYESKARLLGFIPITMPTTAKLGGRGGRVKTADVTLQKQNVIEIDYPWYGFLVPKKSLHAQIELDTKEIAQNYQASQKQEIRFKAGKALAETVK